MTRIIVNAREKNRIGATGLTLNYGLHGHLFSAPTQVIIITEYIYVLQTTKIEINNQKQISFSQNHAFTIEE